MNVVRKLNRVQTTRVAAQMTADYYAELRRAPQEGKKIAWTYGPAPFELLRVLDVAFTHMESYGAYAAAHKGNIELKEIAEAAGYSPDGCSYWRTFAGLAIQLRRGDKIRDDMWLPLPDFVISTSICQAMGLSCASLERQLKVPTFIVDVPPPITLDPSEHRKNVEYVKAQLEGMVAFLEEQTGKRFDYDKLKDIMRLVKEAAALRRECLDLGMNRPSPYTVFDAFLSLGPMHVSRGTPKSVAYFKDLKAELKERVAQHIGAIPDEKYRLWWDNLPIWFKLGALSEKFAEWGANPILGAYTHGAFYYDHERVNPDKPLESIADEVVLLRRLIDGRIRDEVIAKAIKDYSLDGLVMHSARTCRPYAMGQYDAIDTAERKFGVPGIMIDGDPTDPNYYSDSQTHTRLQALIEMMDARKKVR